jgi:hypothetical protein
MESLVGARDKQNVNNPSMGEGYFGGGGGDVVEIHGRSVPE